MQLGQAPSARWTCGPSLLRPYPHHLTCIASLLSIHFGKLVGMYFATMHSCCIGTENASRGWIRPLVSLTSSSDMPYQRHNSLVAASIARHPTTSFLQGSVFSSSGGSQGMPRRTQRQPDRFDAIINQFRSAVMCAR